MMHKQATFYLLEQSEDASDSSLEQVKSLEPVKSNELHIRSLLFCACQQAARSYRQQQKVFIYTPDQTLAHEVDEMLWGFDADSFVPHNLMGEGPSYGSPVEISWQAPTNRCAVLINLTENVPPFTQQFSQVIDFVPNDESLKKSARNRYRQYQQLGFAVKMNEQQQS